MKGEMDKQKKLYFKEVHKQWKYFSNSVVVKATHGVFE